MGGASRSVSELCDKFVHLGAGTDRDRDLFFLYPKPRENKRAPTQHREIRDKKIDNKYGLWRQTKDR